MRHSSVTTAIACRRLPVLMAGFAMLWALASCAVETPEPAPKPKRGHSRYSSGIADHPWDAIPMNIPMPEAAGATLALSDIPPAVTMARQFMREITPQRPGVPPTARRARTLIRYARPTCALGQFGLPTYEPYRQLFAEEAISMVDVNWRILQDVVRPESLAGWMDRTAFAQLPPHIQRGWLSHFRLPDMMEILANGGGVVVLGHPRGGWRLIMLWEAPPGNAQLAALEWVRAGG